MPKCSKIRGRRRQVCVGDLDTLIKLQNRNIVPPIFNNVDFDEDFEDTGEVWAMIKTVSGKTFFAGGNIDVNVTHEIYIMFDENVSTETWIELKGRRIDILNVESLDERDEFMLLTCTDRGSNTLESTKI